MNRLPKFLLGALAVVLVLSLARPALAGDMQGKVMSVDPDRFQLVVDEKGKSVTLHMDEDATVYINDEEATLADLRAGDMVSVISRRDGNNTMAIEIRCRREAD
jgi:hypothetical protein